LSSIGITSSLLSQIAGSPSAANPFVTDLNQLAQDLQSGNLPAAQQDYVTLSQDALDGAASSTATTSASGITTSLLSNIASSPSASSSLVNELNQLGSDLGNGDLNSAQGDMLSLDSIALNAAPASSAAPAASASSSTSSQADVKALINATIEAMAAGETSDIGTDMSELASVSTSSQGASLLQSYSQQYGSGSSSSSSMGSLSQVLQGLNTDSSTSSASPLSLLA
jgi:hypothetical protein